VRKSSDTPAVTRRNDCPFTWCTAARHVPDYDCTMYHDGETVDVPGLGSFHLCATTGGAQRDEPPTVMTAHADWTIAEAASAAEEFARAMRAMAPPQNDGDSRAARVPSQRGRGPRCLFVHQR